MMLLAAWLWVGPAPLRASAPPQKVTIQLKWRHQFQFAGYYAAQRLGYFADAGLDVKLVEGGPRRDPVREVTAGNTSYGIGDSDLLVARAQGLPVVVVAAIFQHSPYVLMTRASEGLKQPKDLVGRRVMVEFDQGEIQAKAMFKREGIDLSRIAFLRQSWDLSDLVEGRTDAMSGYLGVESSQLERRGTQVNIIRPADHGIDFYGDCLFTTAEEARNHPDRVEAVRRAVVRGWAYALQNPEQVSDWILALPGVQERGIRRENLATEAAAMKALILPDIVPLGHINEERWQRTLAIYKELGILPASVGLEGFLFDSGHWLSVRHRNQLALSAAIALGILLLVLGWNLTLRRRVKEGDGNYKQLVESSPGAIFIEYEGRFEFLNLAAVKLFGLGFPEELLGHSVLENVHEEDKPRVQGRVEGFQKHPAALDNTDLRLHRPDGKVVEVEVTTTPIPWKGRTGARVFLRDITDRNAAWQAMAESEENYRQLVENSPDCIFVANGGVFRYVNPAGLKLFEVEAAEELLGRPMLEFVHPMDQHLMEARGQQFRDTGVPMPSQALRMVGRRGHVTLVEVTTTKIRFQGEVAARVFMRDISVWKESEAALKSSQSVLRGFFDGAPFQMGVTEFTEDEDVILISVNAAAAASMGLGVKEAVGMRVSDLGLPGPHRGIWVDQYHQAQDTGEPVHFEMPISMSGRDLCWAVTLACTGKSPNGRPRFAYLVEDVTERRELARALEEREATLRAFYNGAPMLMGVTEVTAEGELIAVSVNEATARSFGTTAARAIGLSASKAGMGEAEQAAWLARYREAEAAERPIHFVLGGQGRDHRDWLSVTIAPLARPEGENPRFCFIAEEITERVRDQEALRSSENRLEEAQRLAHLGSWSWDLSTQALTWSDELCRIYGVEPGVHQPTCEDFISRLHPEDRNHDQDLVARAMSELKSFSHESRIIRPDGEIRIIFDQAEVLVDGQGRATGMAGASQDITERKRAEQALRQSEFEQRQLAERLTAAQAIGHVGSWETDLATMEVSWSQQTHQIFGTDPATFKPDHDAFLALVHPEDRDAVDLALQDSLNQDIDRSIVHRILARDGRMKVVEERWHAFKDAQGRPLRAVGTCQDISERKQAEQTQEALHQISEAAHSTATLPDLFHRIHGIIGGLLPARNFFVALYDESKDELSFPYFVDEQDAPPGPRKLSDGTLTGQVIRSGTALLLTRETREEGSRQQLPVVGSDSLDWLGVPLKSRSRIIGAVVLQSYSGEVTYTGRDKILLEFVSDQVAVAIERKQAEKELREQNDLFQMVQRATNDVICDWDLQTDKAEWNDRVYAMFGYPSEEMAEAGDHWWFDRIHPEERERVVGELQEALERGESIWSDEYRFLRKDGSYAKVLDRGYVVRDAEGKAVRLISAMSDLTLRTRVEEAQAANQAKSEFLATMTHELRTPMIGMLGMVEILSHSQLDEDQRNSLSTIQSSARSLLGIIGDILDFSKIEAGRLELEPQVVSLRLILEEEFASFSGAASNKGLVMASEIDQRLAGAHLADPARFREILSNFFSNALKFTHEGRIGLRVEVLDSDAVSQTLAIRVWDTGIGVSAENQKRLFQPFVQAESTTTRRFGGTGLGLSISLRLAQMMGGRITMESREGEGTTMSFIAAFPLADPAEPSPAAQLAVWDLVEPPDRETALAAGCLVLLAEDHPTNRVVLTRQLQLAGYQVDTTEDGVAALAAWNEHHYGLVLTDIHMPRMDGYQLALEIRRGEGLGGRTRIPILALTANALHGELERCLAAGMDDCIIKPINIPGLQAKLRYWLPAASRLIAPRPPDPSSVRAAVAEPSPGGPPVDMDYLANFTHGDPAGALEILQDYCQVTSLDVVGLRLALACGDKRELVHRAHRIKGASLMVGAKAMAELAQRFEQTAPAGEMPELTALLAALEADFAAVERFTRDQLEPPPLA